jgi:hypothetical protein
MVNKYFKVLFFLLTVVIFLSCEKKTIELEKTVTPRNTTDTIHFTADIIPIFVAKCNGCHGSGGQNPVMEVAVAYQNVMNGYVTAGSPSTSSLYLKLTETGGSHEGRSSVTELGKISQWITQGAKNN